MKLPVKISYNWQYDVTHRDPVTRKSVKTGEKSPVLRYSVWIENDPHFGWSHIADYGVGAHVVYTSFGSERAAAEALLGYERDYGGTNNRYGPAPDGHAFQRDEEKEF